MNDAIKIKCICIHSEDIHLILNCLGTLRQYRCDYIKKRKYIHHEEIH